ncbi:peptide/nickel transport system permease protein [Halanaerobium saccharolyticum]|uniref:Peptide/nickel transport system permease protein n=2 Tax=Halanaerobium saccharolyticum TaxID=43595 RepID=A0A4V3CF19_9FIRM|nr:ABC transporter permease [Halanaerobium saccharolyticum]TDO92073.1 peptide/nickel transport system permease protein [Halanaerobium saccharolyticum]
MKNNSSESKITKDEDIVMSNPFKAKSHWQLMWEEFKNHKLAMGGIIVLILLYVSALFAGFLTPYDPNERFSKFPNIAPMQINIFDDNGLTAPYVHPIVGKRNMETLAMEYTVDQSQQIPVNFLYKSDDTYNFLGLFKTNLKLFGSDETQIFLFGTDGLGRDIFTRTIHGARLSLTVGLVGIAVSLVLGLFFGGISGYLGGMVDNFIQRVIEFTLAIPKIPLWMGLGAALPQDWSVIQVYFAITVILSLTGWVSMARVLRGQILSLKEEDFVKAARAAGAKSGRIISKHLIPNCMSYILVNLTLAIPGMIIGETALSFLGLGLKAPAVSWGVLLQEAQNVRAVAQYPWYFIPGVFVIVAVLAFNFVGDGLRDAADPYH